MTPVQISDTLEKHRLWLIGEDGGERAALRGAALRGADLRGAALSGADLRGAALRGADLRDAALRDAALRGADLRDAALRGADLNGAALRDVDLRGAALSGADLRGADLRGADLRGADLRGADLRGADLRGADLPHYEITPAEGAFIAWKGAGGAVLKLEIPADAGRTSSLVGRKCRAERVRVLSGWLDGVEMQPGESVTSSRGGVYTIGEEYRPDSYDPNPRVECTHGVHFFMTRREAEEWR